MLWLTIYVGLSGVLSFLLLTWVYRVALKTPLKKRFLLFVFFNTSWIFSNFLMITTNLILFFKLVHALGFVASVMAFIWTLQLKSPDSRISPYIVSLLYSLGAIIAVFCFIDGVFFLGDALKQLDLYHSYGPFFYIYSLLTIFILVLMV